MIDTQLELSKYVEFKEINNVEVISGVDVTYTEHNAVTSIVTIDINNLEILEEVITQTIPKTEYISGLFAFRELPAFLKAWNKLSIEPDVVMFDGYGILHPRKMGLATHASFFIDKPTIGVAKNSFIGNYKNPSNSKGSFEYISCENEILGASVRTMDNVKPVYVSVGNKIKLEQCIDIVLKVTNSHSHIPYPTRMADLYSRKYIRDNKVL